MEKVNYLGHDLAVVDKGGRQYAAMKPLVEAMGLDWRAQHRLIQNDSILSSVMVVMKFPGADGKRYKMLALPLEYLNGWLFLVPVLRYRGELRERLMSYQRKCYYALGSHFCKCSTQTPPEHLVTMSDFKLAMAGREAHGQAKADMFRAAEEFFLVMKQEPHAVSMLPVGNDCGNRFQALPQPEPVPAYDVVQLDLF